MQKEINQGNSAPKILPSVLSDLNNDFSDQVEDKKHPKSITTLDNPPRDNDKSPSSGEFEIIDCSPSKGKGFRANTCSFAQFDDEFHQELLNFNNNKLFLPEICELHQAEKYNFWKFPSENVLFDLSIHLNILALDENIPAITILTNYRILFVPKNKDFLVERQLRSDYFSIPLMLINKFHSKNDKKKALSNTLNISTKCGRKFKLSFSYEDSIEANKLSETLERFIPPQKLFTNFAFAFHSRYPDFEEKYKGWQLFNLDNEYQRQGVIFEQPSQSNEESVPRKNSLTTKAPFKKFSNYDPKESQWVCDSYPPEVIVPSLLETDEILKTAKYRTKHRLPVLVFHYANEDHPVSIWRSSQCKPGFARQRSTEDELYLRIIGNPNKRDTSKEGPVNLHIYDARPYLNAIANKMNGKGYENLSYYRNTEIFFLDIDNIHGVRDKYKKLIKIANTLSADKRNSSLEHSSWVDSLAYILTGAKSIVEKSIKKGFNVLVHCSDGWDRTTQLVSLVQIMLDPFFRTIEGFQVLIEKDWVSYGHMFRSRSGWKGTSFEEDRRAPIFIQFLDCVHQLHYQFPAEFEFNLRFLTDIAYYSRTGFFGTFLCDNMEELIKNGVRDNTTSIWSFINANKEMYKSSLKKALSKHATFFKNEILPDTNLINMRFWREMFCFYGRNALEEAFKNVELDSKNDLYEITLAIQMKHNNSLQKEKDVLQDKVLELTKELEKLKMAQNSVKEEST